MFDQAGQFAGYRCNFSINRLLRFISDEMKIVRYFKLCIEFAERSTGDIEKMTKVLR